MNIYPLTILRTYFILFKNEQRMHLTSYKQIFLALFICKNEEKIFERMIDFNEI